DKIVKLANVSHVPARDRIMISSLHEECLRYSFKINQFTALAQKVTEKAYSTASFEERANLIKLATARDALFESPEKASLERDFENTLRIIADLRKASNNSGMSLYDDFMKQRSSILSSTTKN